MFACKVCILRRQYLMTGYEASRKVILMNCMVGELGFVVPIDCFEFECLIRSNMHYLPQVEHVLSIWI